MIEAIRVVGACYHVQINGTTVGAIVRCKRPDDRDGWRYNNFIPGKRGSRTISDTKEKAAQRYFGRVIPFSEVLVENPK